MTTCVGSVWLASTGLLEGKRITTDHRLLGLPWRGMGGRVSCELVGGLVLVSLTRVVKMGDAV